MDTERDSYPYLLRNIQDCKTVNEALSKCASYNRYNLMKAIQVRFDISYNEYLLEENKYIAGTYTRIDGSLHTKQS